MDLSVILVSYNTAETTLRALRHLFASDHALEMEVVVVDNASKDGSAETIARAYPDIPIVKNAVNVGFGRANNQALDLVKGRYLLLLNTDAFVGAQTIASTVGYMEQHPSCGILGAKLVGGDGKLQPSCRYFPTPWNLFLMESGIGRFFKGVQMVDNMAWDHDSVRSCDWVPGCYYLVRREVVDRVGLFDPVFFMYCEEVDHCHATKKAGWEVTYFPEPVVHLGGESARTEGDISEQGRQLAPLQIESEFIYFHKNMGLAGVVARLLLATTANAMGLIKNGIRLAPVSVLQSHFRQSWLTWRLFFSTHLGTRSSR